MSLRRRTPWNVKPPIAATGLNRDHQLARGLLGLWLFNEGAGNAIDLVREVPAVATNGVTRIPTRLGEGASFDGVNDYFALTPALYAPGTGPRTVVASFATTQTAAGLILGGYQNGSPFGGLGVGVNTNAANVFSYWDGSLAGWADGSTVANSGAPITYGVSHDGTTSGSTFYVNGAVDVARTSGNSVTYTGALAIGAISDGSGTYFTGTLFWLMLYGRVLSADEHRSLALEPYAMLRPLVRRRPVIFTPPAAAPAVASGVFHERLIGRGIAKGVMR